jgi:formylglycine-generating enzyme required for sulfatase activity
MGGMPTTAKCPDDMVLAGSFCIDRYEAPNQKGAKPLVMQSAVGADKWCKQIGKRLCTEDEWEAACEGPQKSVYPYGNKHITSACNDDKIWKVVNESVLATWPSPAAQAEVQKLYQGDPSGSNDKCVSTFGAFDLTGNVEEWVVRTQPHANNYPHVLKGCYWSGCYGGSKPTCQSTNPAHPSGFMFYETGFRCCKDAAM